MEIPLVRSSNKFITDCMKIIVQMPIMAIICSRYLQAKNFLPKLYFQLGIRLNKDGQFLKAVSIINYNVKEESKPWKEPPPLLHDLSSLQQEANKRKGYTADQTLNLLQNLYESKLVSYPRTGSRYIGDDVYADVPQLISQLTTHPEFGKSAEFLQTVPLNKRSVNGKKVTDHMRYCLRG